MSDQTIIIIAMLFVLKCIVYKCFMNVVKLFSIVFALSIYLFLQSINYRKMKFIQMQFLISRKPDLGH